ncbi:DUF3418 domain-containing protein [Serratia marcescens]|nr:DUF3418 domain-containing protein [Serratia marcescens]
MEERGQTAAGSAELRKEMLIKDGANKISALDYPNFWHQGNLKLRLSYQFEPGTDADGVTVHIPLPILNQVEEQGFEWQIPAFAASW